jgi:hypothetical protein
MRMNFVAGFALLALFATAARPSAAQTLYWIDTNHGAPVIHRADGDGSVLTSHPLAPGSLPEGLAVDGAGRVYWGEAAWTGAKIQTAGGLFGAPATVVSGGSVIRGVAVNWAERQVYWTTSNLVTGPMLRRAPTTGGPAVTLLALGAGANPRGLAIDPAGDKLYWADFDRDILYRSNLDGSGLVALVTFAPGTGPYGVAFDPTMQRVFWSEYNTGLVRHCSTDGSGVTTRASGLFQPTHLTLDTDGLRYFVIDSGVGHQAILRGGMYAGGAPITLPTVVQTYGGIAFASAATVGVPEPGPGALPLEFALDSPSPNPAVGPVRFQFALPREASFRLAAYDVRGRQVAVLAEGTLPAGVHHAWWSPREADGTMPAGMYFARLVAEGCSWTRRVVFVR